MKFTIVEILREIRSYKLLGGKIDFINLFNYFKKKIPNKEVVLFAVPTHYSLLLYLPVYVKKYLDKNLELYIAYFFYEQLSKVDMLNTYTFRKSIAKGVKGDVIP